MQRSGIYSGTCMCGHQWDEHEPYINTHDKVAYGVCKFEYYPELKDKYHNAQFGPHCLYYLDKNDLSTRKKSQWHYTHSIKYSEN